MVDQLPGNAGRVARQLAAAAAGRGALAVVLAGSFSRGDAYPASDLDLHCVGDGPSYELLRWEPYLVSLSWAPEGAQRAALRDPARVAGAVPGWRNAVILHDPEGIAAALQGEARAWSWEAIGDAALNAWVADGVHGYAEEVHKLVTNRAAGRLTAAAVQRSVLALRLARYLAVYLRILYDSENYLWDLVSAAMGEEWRRAQAAALGLGGEPLDIASDAAIELFALACRRVWDLFDERQRDVVGYACRLGGHPI